MLLQDWILLGVGVFCFTVLGICWLTDNIYVKEEESE